MEIGVTGFRVDDGIGMEVGEEFSFTEVGDETGEEIRREVGVIVVSDSTPVWLLSSVPAV
jgi:hypothetical protein